MTQRMVQARTKKQTTTDVLTAPDYLSPSSISTFHQCPLKYKYSRIDGIKEPPTEATLMGTFVHEVLEGFYSLAPSDRTVHSARTLASSAWQNYEKDASIVLRGNVDSIRAMRWRAWWCIEKLMAMEDVAEVHFDGIETELNAEIDGVKIKGFVDRWHFDGDSIVIGDYKTGKVPREPYRDDKFDQLLIYGIILSESMGKELKSVELLYIGHGQKLSKTPTGEDIARVKKMIVDTRAEIDKRCQTEVFEARPSMLCNWCYFKKTCPEWS